jgi:hypothetical protein
MAVAALRREANQRTAARTRLEPLHITMQRHSIPVSPSHDMPNQHRASTETLASHIPTLPLRLPAFPTMSRLGGKRPRHLDRVRWS